VKKHLTSFSHARAEEACLSREGLHAVFLRHEPCGGAAPQDRVLGEAGRWSCPPMGDWLLGSTGLQSAGDLGRAS